MKKKVERVKIGLVPFEDLRVLRAKYKKILESIRWRWGTEGRKFYEGWWDVPRSDLEVLCLIHGEVSECQEAFREGNPNSAKISSTAAEEELADIVIRVLDFAQAKGWDLYPTIAKKIVYNIKRPYRHGKKF